MSTTTPHPDYRDAIMLALSVFTTPATNDNSMARASAFVCHLSGTIAGYGDKDLGDAVFAIVQPPQPTAVGAA